MTILKDDNCSENSAENPAPCLGKVMIKLQQELTTTELDVYLLVKLIISTSSFVFKIS